MPNKMSHKTSNLSRFGNFSPENMQLASILYIGRASSIFFTGLFDGHPAVMVLPSFFYPSEYDTKSKQYIAKMCYQEMSISINSVIGSMDEQKYSFDKFEDNFCDYLNAFGVNRRNIFLAVYYSFAKMMKKDLNLIKTIVFDPHGAEGVLKSFQDFPDERIIVLARDPRQSYLSFKLKEQALYGLIDGTKMFRAYNFIKNEAAPSSICIVKHEALHADYKTSLNKICKFTGIKYHPSLEKSSFFGKDYDGSTNKVSSVTKLYSSVPSPIYAKETWSENLSTHEIEFIQFFERNKMREFRYRPVDPYSNPRFIFFGTLFNPLTRCKLERDTVINVLLWRPLLAISRAPIIGYCIVKFAQFIFHLARYIKANAS